MTDPIDQLRRLDPTAETDPAATVTPQTRAALLDGITSSGADTSVTPLRSRRRSFLTRRLAPALVAASLLGGVALTSVELSGDTRDEALSFRTEGESLKIRIVDLHADTKRFNKELKKHDLNFELELAPVSPSIVGQANAASFSGDSNSRTVQSGLVPAGCELGGSAPCHLEITVGKNFRGSGGIQIGRPAKPGENYQSTGDLDGRGEALEGVKFRGMQVDAVRQILTKRGHKIRDFRVELEDEAKLRKSVPGDWIVHDGVSWNATEVTLWAKAPKR